MIDQIEDKGLLTLYTQLLEREINKTSKDYFDTTENDLISRAKASINSIEQGKTRSIKDFKQDVNQWKQDKAF